MGRIFEVRKSTIFARWDRMAKQFTRIGKEIAIAVKTGPDPNKPDFAQVLPDTKNSEYTKDRVEAAIKRAMGRIWQLRRVLYEGYAPWHCSWLKQPLIILPAL
jgi:transcriptional/translational regulatory protein YebC/TACO1